MKTTINMDALEKGWKAGLKKLESCVVVPKQYTKQEAAMVFNFQECLKVGIETYLKEVSNESNN